MSEKTNATKRIILIIVIVAMLAAGLILTISLSNNDTDVQIVLPSPSALPEAEPSESASQSDSLLSVNPENVKDVLSTVTRPSSYHRALEIDIISGSDVTTRGVEIWVRENSQYFELTSGTEQQHILISDGCVSIWYDGEEDIHSFDENRYFSADDLIGIPTYEDVLNADESLITSADFVSNTDGTSSLYVEFLSDDSRYSERYWVSLETGLLTEAMSLYDGDTVYSMRETYMQQLPATDAEFDNKFVIPEA